MSTENTFHLVVASVGETKFDGRALAVTVPGTAGVLTLLPHHEPLITTLKSGTITVRTPTLEGDAPSAPVTLDIESGVLECSANRVVVLL